jgi:hypothetical protein
LLYLLKNNPFAFSSNVRSRISSLLEVPDRKGVLTIPIIRMKHTQSPDQQWDLQKVKLELRFTFLTDIDFRYDYGRKEVMMTSLQIKLGKSREALNELLAQL